jgi:Protein of unknown function (DUF3100)
MKWGLPHFVAVACVLAAIAIAQVIGLQRLALGSVTITLLPLVFAFMAGVAMNPAIMRPLAPLWGGEAGEAVARSIAGLVSPAVMPLIVVLTASVGAEFKAVLEAGPALLLQEVGNLGTMLFAMPLAVLAFGMGREAIGATFSIAREGGLAFVFDKYGPNTPEATGVMAVYICGTFIGTALFAVMPPLVEATGVFDMRALAMACGTGSASMTAACATALGAVDPAREDLIGALAAASNLLTGLIGLFVTVFVTIPLAEAYFKGLTRLRGRGGPP